MSDSDVNVKIKTSSEGNALVQAKTELEGLKDTAAQTSSSTSNLQSRISGLSTLTSALTSLLHGANNSLRGLAVAAAACFQILVAHPIGRLITVLAALGVTLYELSQKFLAPKQNAKELADTAEATEAALLELNKVDLPFEAARKGLSELLNQYKAAAAAAKTLQQAQDELLDATLATQLAKLDLKEEKALAGAGPDETKRKAIQADFSQQRLDARYTREAQKAKTDQAERSRELWAAKNEAENLQRTLPGLEGQAQDIRDSQQRRRENLQRIQGSPALRGAAGKELIAKYDEPAQKDAAALAEFEKTIKETKQRLAELTTAIQAAELAERAAIQKRNAIDISYSTATSKSARVYNEDRAAAADQRKKEQTAADQRENEKNSADQRKKEQAALAAAKLAAEPRVKLALQQQQAEAQSAAVQLQAAQAAAGRSGPGAARRQNAAARAQTAFYKESADVAQAAALAEQIKAAVDQADLNRLLQALDSIGQSVAAVINQSAAKADQVSAQIRNGGLRTK